MDEIVNYIYKTTDRSKFKLLHMNRWLDEAHLKKLEKAVTSNDCLASNPISVTKDFYVVDGQHRLLIARKLNLPIYYFFTSTQEADKAIQTNATQKPWIRKDWTHLYRALNKEEYLKLQAFQEALRITEVQAFRILFPSQKKQLAEEIMNGTLVMPDFEEKLIFGRKVMKAYTYLIQELPRKRFLHSQNVFRSLVHFVNRKDMEC